MVTKKNETLKADDKAGNEAKLIEVTEEFNAAKLAWLADQSDDNETLMVESASEMRRINNRVKTNSDTTDASKLRPDVAKAAATLRTAAGKDSVIAAVKAMATKDDKGVYSQPHFTISYNVNGDGVVTLDIIKGLTGRKGKGSGYTDADTTDSEPKTVKAETPAS